MSKTHPNTAPLNRFADATLSDKEPPVSADSPLSKMIGQYEILEMIGQGGMGTVYEAVHPHLNRVVALKMICRDCQLDDPTAKERFVREMRVLGRLDRHPNIVHVYDTGIDGDTLFIAMEYLEGRDLGTLIGEPLKMPVKDAADCLRQAATGLAYTHKTGYVHRDIKPSNLFLTDDSVIKILDFGLARKIEEGGDFDQTETDDASGCEDFMAPERLRDKKADVRSDIYSLGQSFVRILTGPEQDWDGEPIPPELKPILDRMTAELPDQRYQTMDELIEAIDSSFPDVASRLHQSRTSRL